MSTDIKFGNDIEIANGDIALVSGADAAGQRIRHRLLTFRGEWFLDTQFGPPYREQVFVRNPRLDVIGALIRDQILQSAQGQFTAFSASLNDLSRNLTMSFAIDLADGAVSDTVTVG